MAAKATTPLTTPPATVPTDTPDEEVELRPNDPVVPFDVGADECGIIAIMFSWESATHLH